MNKLSLKLNLKNIYFRRVILLFFAWVLLSVKFSAVSVTEFTPSFEHLEILTLYTAHLLTFGLLNISNLPHFKVGVLVISSEVLLHFIVSVYNFSSRLCSHIIEGFCQGIGIRTWSWFQFLEITADIFALNFLNRKRLNLILFAFTYLTERWKKIILAMTSPPPKIYFSR